MRGEGRVHTHPSLAALAISVGRSHCWPLMIFFSAISPDLRDRECPPALLALRALDLPCPACLPCSVRCFLP